MSTSETRQVIDLAGVDGFPAYAAIHSESIDHPNLLSPAVMRWSEQVLLVRLSDCQTFWLNQKKKRRCSLPSLFSRVLEDQLGADYVAVFGAHPWQCLLYLGYQLSHQGRGCFFLQSRLHQNIYRHLDWDLWFETQEDLIEHLESINARGFEASEFRRRQQRLQRFIKRADIRLPVDMAQLHANNIMRRFGTWIGRLWRWTFGDVSSLSLFPWVSLQPQELPTVRRDLEYPVNQWEVIEVMLREDFSRLCEQFFSSKNEHVNRIDWEITLFNYQKLLVPLSFRHPYSLHHDQPAFDTVLYQARYVYDDVMQKLRQRDKDLDLPETMPFISWQVTVCERIPLPPQLWDLFAHEQQADYQQVRALQNKLPLPLECYQPADCFYPELSFQPMAVGDDPDNEYDSNSWSSASIERPLFYYSEVQPIEPPLQHGCFLERSAAPWWQTGQLVGGRDYYIVRDQRGRASWVYRTREGCWFRQGEYV